MPNKSSGAVGYTLIGLFVVTAFFFGYDILLSKPEHLKGVIIEKIYVPSRTSSGATPYGGTRRANYFVTVQKEEQWVALVKMDNGEILQVHLHPDHYKVKNVGDNIHFKKFEGYPVHIQYFAHSEEEE